MKNKVERWNYPLKQEQQTI